MTYVCTSTMQHSEKKAKRMVRNYKMMSTKDQVEEVANICLGQQRLWHRLLLSARAVPCVFLRHFEFIWISSAIWTPGVLKAPQMS